MFPSIYSPAEAVNNLCLKSCPELFTIDDLRFSTVPTLGFPAKDPCATGGIASIKCDGQSDGPTNTGYPMNKMGTARVG